MIKRLAALTILLIISTTLSSEPITREKAAQWIDANYQRFFQKYYLSCEAAISRMVLNMIGIRDLDEDAILESLPRHPTNPDLGLVMKDVSGDIYNKDGTINWGNYGAHADVLHNWFSMITKQNKKDKEYRFEKTFLTNAKLVRYLKSNKDCLGAIIWVAAPINEKKPPRNERGQVLGEHVQLVSPLPDKKGRMVVYDVWPWPGQPFHLYNPFNRDMFDYVVLLIKRIDKE
ncbi:MAG: hypothetical protein JW969_00865 [Spirochaetales bacterium]|nr:hypothetical protein [Spirochaetales bacterium]